MGQTDPCAPGYEAQYVLQMLESQLMAEAEKKGAKAQILRTGLLYGPCMPLMAHPLTEMAKKTVREEPFTLTLTQKRNSYICIHDVLTAVQFVLTRCPDRKIFNVSGLHSNASDGEIAMMLYQNFPGQCHVTMRSADPADPTATDGVAAEQIDPATVAEGDAVVDRISPTGIWLNTQLLEHYGFQPKISLEDGLIILVKSLQNTGEVFIFDNTYLGKLEKVQQILLGYLLEIDRICKKHGIKYFLAGGTLLGAIRHHGFIPWDDDADVMMLREDYDKFQQVVQQELPDNIFMQIPTTEKGNYNPFTKLRINNTMFATEFTGHFMDMHNGIFFDVLSHDKTANHKWSQKLHLMITMLTRSIVFNKWGDTDIKGGGAHPVICKIVDHVKYLIPMPLALRAQNHSLEFFRNRKSKYLYDGMGRNLNRGAFPAEWLDEVEYVDFEGYKFPVPKEYDQYLTYLYGDYMQMIPVSQRRTSHSIVLMDLGMYSDYQENAD
jgi:lipopolysaccharide cholinephosphotransferase